ncbi:hypothetical protein TD95_001357 [Thielaviopsis punctulata]|uniref:Mediator of RNA polymerase II transcription subunit 18 n=1 Tax=Thielaviopsis punctulata TaxID=72032 RepID=A0A0F4ZHM7_9PEZI|nr:hypothetical protein TD95_001357 [Thielaviopsis punctulata]
MLELFLTAIIDPEDEPKARAVLKGLCARSGYETYTRSLHFQGPARPTAMSNLSSADKSSKSWAAAAPFWKALQIATTKRSYNIELRYEIPYDGFGPRPAPVDYNALDGILRFVDFPDPPAPSTNRAITARKKVEIWGQKNLPRVLQDNSHVLKGELVDHTIQYFDDRGIEFCLSRQFYVADPPDHQPANSSDSRSLAPFIPPPEDLQPVDQMKRSFLFVRLHVIDDNKPDEVVRGMDQLQAVQRELEGAFDFKHLDRRAFDTRVPLEVRTAPAPLPQVVPLGDH